MTTKIIDLEQQAASLDELLAQLDDHSELVLVRGERTIARVIAEAAPPRGERVPGLHAGTTWVSDDFDAALPDSFWLGEE